MGARIKSVGTITKEIKFDNSVARCATIFVVSMTWTKKTEEINENTNLMSMSIAPSVMRFSKVPLNLV